MADVPSNAQIIEVDGAHYPAQLESIPRVGELIDLYSHIDASTGHPTSHFYEVVQVVHKVQDVTEKKPKGTHFVVLYVKKSQSRYVNP